MNPLIRVKDLRKYFPVKGGLFNRTIGQVHAVDGVSFDIAGGTTMGLVGESGCGKTTLGRVMLQLQPPTIGQVLIDGEDIAAMSGEALIRKRRDMQIIFQDPYASLSPRRTILQTLLEPLNTHSVGTPAERRRKVEELLEVVGLRKAVLHRYPHEFSGGQRQRIGIARALALEPKFIVADECVSALDVSVQSQVLNLIARLQRERGITFLFISHDLAVVQHVSHTVGVMYLGQLVEFADAATLYRRPSHPYTQALLSAAPVPDPKTKRRRIMLEGDVPSPMNPPSGCPFHTRCPKVMDLCRNDVPRTVNLGDETHPHLINCHLHDGSSPVSTPVPG